MYGQIRLRVLFSVLCSAGLFSGCASVQVKKLGDLDGPSGLRYYMPRPYISVHEPFIVAGESTLADGVVTPDGQYVWVQHLADAEFAAAFSPRPDGTGFTGEYVASQAGQLQSGLPGVDNLTDMKDALEKAKKLKELLDAVGGKKDGADPAPGEPGKDEGAPDKEGGEKKPGPKTGVINQKATNDPTVYSHVPLKRYFDIIYLPDFEQEYVVEGKAGLGNASIQLALGQGWSLQGLEATADNSEIQKRIYGLIDTGMNLITQAAQAKLGLPVGQLQSGGAEKRFSGGTPVTLKISRLRIVAPGLYPILKPEEYKDLNVAAMQAAHGNRMLIPVYPYTNIAFNTYETFVIEAAVPTGDTALDLHLYPELPTKAQATGGIEDGKAKRSFEKDESAE